MPKTKTKPLTKTKKVQKPVAKRVHTPVRPSRTTPQRMRQAPHAPRRKPPQKARPSMNAAEETKDPRGAGSGEHANTQRNRTEPTDEKDIAKHVHEDHLRAVKSNQQAVDEKKDEPDDEDDKKEKKEKVEATKYPEGDPERGALDPENLDRPIAQRDRRAYLVQQAERNEAANDQLNAMQVSQNRRVQNAPLYLQDPDYMRETSMETAIAALKLHDPSTFKARKEAVEKRRQERADYQKQQAQFRTNPATPAVERQPAHH